MHNCPCLLYQVALLAFIGRKSSAMKSTITQITKTAEKSEQREKASDDPAVNEQPEVLTPVESAVFLRVGISWIYRHANQLGACRVGKFLRFQRKRLQEYLDSTRTENRKPTSVSRRDEKSALSESPVQK